LTTCGHGGTFRPKATCALADSGGGLFAPPNARTTTNRSTPPCPLSVNRRRTPRRLVPLVPASEYSRLSVKTLRRRITDGTITGYRAGPKLIMVDLDEIDGALIRPIPSAGNGGA